MKIQHWKHENVLIDGTVPNESGIIEGSVGVEPEIRISEDGVGGCGTGECRCSEGHWVMINFGRNEETEIVSGVTVRFDNWGEMQLFLSTRQMK